MSQTDRVTGLVGYSGVKVPVMCISTSNLTLSGEQTVNGTAVVTGDRVLVNAQTSAINNGIYVVDTGDWERSQDCDGPYDLVQGSMIFSYAQLKFYYLTTTDPVIGTSSLSFSQAPIDTSGASAYFSSLFPAASASALRALMGITRVDYATGAGTVDAITANFTFDFSAWDQTALMMVQATGANTSTTPTFSPDGLTAKTIVKGSDTALAAGDIPGADATMILRYDTSLDKVELLNPATGVTQVAQPIPGSLQNFGAAVTLAANALTFALKGANGSDPSASNTVSGYYQSATATTGTAAKRTVTSALSITIPNGATVGTISGVASRIYFGLLDNAGALELCYWKGIETEASFGSVYGNVKHTLRVSQDVFFTTVANTTGSDSACQPYSDSVRSNVRIIPIAYVDSTQATAGVWVTAIAKLTLIGPDTKQTGDVIQEILDLDGGVATGTNVIPLDDTPPDSAASEGNLYMGVAMTATSIQNFLDVEFCANFANSAATDGFVGYVNTDDGLEDCIVQAGNIVAAGDQIIVTGKRLFTHPGSVSAGSNYNLYAGGSAAGTTTFNGRAGGRLYGGAMSSYLSVKERAA